MALRHSDVLLGRCRPVDGCGLLLPPDGGGESLTGARLPFDSMTKWGILGVPYGGHPRATNLWAGLGPRLA